MPARALSFGDRNPMATGPGSGPALATILASRAKALVAPTRRSRCPLRLVRKAQRGDDQAFGLLWRRYAPTVHGILLSMVADHEADDLAQEVGLSAWKALPDLQEPNSFPAWLCTIARNAGRDALQRQRDDAPLIAAKHVAAPPADTSLEADEILAEIRTLPACHREPLVLRLLLEMSGPEIAARTGLTEGSVRVNLCRGMKLLRERLKHWEDRDG